ncbi:hypothetical protein PZ61_0236045 [Streptomyces sp. MNU77]|uniref:HtaA domain-containing protein n=1 Tax=Streptomyces sp. MNU77 TaxID=1573406 RepID=UPI0005E777FC|nr:HtaA domain-containing protein [Streptomyces sp. MNU77]OLO25840.1 hypothetical protein PZ61_0236045 [Streptomyces sp. MNU77]
MPDPDTARPGGRGLAPGPPGLRWGIKQRFLQYIARMPDSRCSVTDGASVTEERAFLFTPASWAEFDTATSTGVVRFRGDVRFAGHHGLLFVRVADPWLSVAADGTATLSIAAAPSEQPDRIPLATLALVRSAPSAGWLRYHGHHVALTEQGSELFNTVYPAGEHLDDLSVLRPPEPLPQELP